MSKILPAPGNYRAKLNGQIRIGDPEDNNNFLKVFVPYTLLNSEVAYSGVHEGLFASADGTLYQRSIDDFRKVFNWTTPNPFDLQDVEGEFEFELNNCAVNSGKKEDEAGNPIMYFNSGFLNPIGAGGGRMPEVLDEDKQKSVLAKYLSKFKAVGPKAATSKPVVKPAAKPTTPELPAKSSAPARSAAPTPPSRKTAGGQPRTLTADEVWTLLKAKFDNMADDALMAEVNWWDTLAEVTGDANTDPTPAQWGEIATKLGV